MNSLSLDLGKASSYRIEVHPMVVMQILEFYYRQLTNKVMGTLLGNVYPNYIEITNCFGINQVSLSDESNVLIL